MSRILKWIGITFLGMVTLFVVGCSTVLLPNVSVKPAGVKASPSLLVPMGGMAQVDSVEVWETERAPFWTNMLLSQVYGSRPPELDVRIEKNEVLNTDLFDGAATLRAVRLGFGPEDLNIHLDVHFVVPNTEGPHPVVLGAGFCPNQAAMPFEGVEPPDGDYPDFCDGSYADALFQFIFGKHISSPPLEKLVAHGFAFGAYYPGQIIPDSSELAPVALANFPKTDMSHGPYAAIGVWAWAASQIEDFIEAEPSLDESRVVLFGHSRYGKSSLLAGALDKRIAGVIAHQSGTGGASLQKNDVGEPISAITKAYPHWFTATYQLYADRADEMPFDQHALVALLAPRPVLLGNSRRDQWSDPQGAFDSARAAGAVWELYGEPGFRPKNLKDFNPNDRLAYSIRGGTHGITTADWALFLPWLDAQFGEAD